MSVITSRQVEVLFLLLRGHFSPQYFPAILDVSAHGRSTLEGDCGNKGDKCQEKHNLMLEARLWLAGWAAPGGSRPRPPRESACTQDPDPARGNLKHKVPTAQGRLGATAPGGPRSLRARAEPSPAAAVAAAAASRGPARRRSPS